MEGKIKTLVFETDNGNGWYGTLKIERNVWGNINFDDINLKMISNKPSFFCQNSWKVGLARIWCFNVLTA